MLTVPLTDSRVIQEMSSFGGNYLDYANCGGEPHLNYEWDHFPNRESWGV